MKTLSRFILCILLLSSPAARAEGAPQTIDLAGLKVAVWLPKDSAGAPVVLFSHGYVLCSAQSAFLMQALVDAGYAVFAPGHSDGLCRKGELSEADVEADALWAPFLHPESWSDASHADRKEDLEKLLDLLPKDQRYRRLDWSRLGVAGHSLGGYAALALAGAWPSWKDKRVKAVLAFAPYCGAFLAKHTLLNIDVPVMFQEGTRDYFDPGAKKVSEAYDQTPAPKYFITLEEARHYDWTDRRGTYHDIIDAYSIAFFDTYLKGRPFPQGLMRKGGNVAEVRIDTGK